jgi:hypothetical protein
VLPTRPKQSTLIGKYHENIITNYYDLAFFNEDKIFNQFEVVFDPEIPRDSRKLIRQAVQNIEGEIINKVGPYVLKGTIVWASPKTPKTQKVYRSSRSSWRRTARIEHEFVVKLQKPKHLT